MEFYSSAAIGFTVGDNADQITLNRKATLLTHQVSEWAASLTLAHSDLEQQLH